MSSTGTTQSTLTSILQSDIFNPSSSSHHLTLLITHPQNLPVRPLHLPLLFVPCASGKPSSTHKEGQSKSLQQDSCILFSLNESHRHYQSIYQRLNRKRATFQIVDLFGYVCGEKAGCSGEGHAGDNEDQLDALIEEFLSEDSTHCQWQNVRTVIIDDFHVLAFYFNERQILRFVRALLDKNLHLVLSMEQMDMISNAHDILNAMANVVVNVHGLESGYSKDVHGLMRVTYSEVERIQDANSGMMHVREKVLQYKVTDREVKLFGKGHRGLF